MKKGEVIMENKEIEIVPGDGNIDISPAEDSINEIPKTKKPKKEDIVIPKTKKD